MAGKIHQLKQEVAALEEKTKEFVDLFRNRYQAYLELLSEAASKHLILASYQVCTQKYPQEFLKLSYSQRQKLQESIKQIGKNSKDKLLELLTKKHSKIKREINILEEMLLGLETTEVTETETEDTPHEASEELLNLQNPDDLLDWIQHIEKGIIQVLDDLSMALNDQLQQYKLIPPQLPKQVITMALQAEVADQVSTSGNPNLLDVLIETETKSSSSENTEDKNNPAKITKLIAIHLRLTEIEFAEPNLSLQRKAIRQLIEQTQQLKKQYYKKQKECAIAEAESAWRASWYE